MISRPAIALILIAFLFVSPAPSQNKKVSFDGQAALIGTSSLPVLVDLAVMIGFAMIMLFLGAYFIEKSEGA